MAANNISDDAVLEFMFNPGKIINKVKRFLLTCENRGTGSFTGCHCMYNRHKAK